MNVGKKSHNSVHPESNRWRERYRGSNDSPTSFQKFHNILMKLFYVWGIHLYVRAYSSILRDKFGDSLYLIEDVTNNFVCLARFNVVLALSLISILSKLTTSGSTPQLYKSCLMRFYMKELAVRRKLCSCERKTQFQWAEEEWKWKPGWLSLNPKFDLTSKTKTNCCQSGCNVFFIYEVQYSTTIMRIDTVVVAISYEISLNLSIYPLLKLSWTRFCVGRSFYFHTLFFQKLLAVVVFLF